MPFRFLSLLLSIAALAGCGRGGGDGAKTKESTPATMPGTAAPLPAANDDAKPSAAAAKPTVFATRDLAKVLNLAALPQLEGTKFHQKTPAHVSATAPGKVAEVAEFYRAKMAALGWETVPIPGVQLTDEHGSLQFVKDGHIARLHLGKGYREGKGPIATSLTFEFHGNFDARTLPSRDGKMTPDSTPMMALYGTGHSVPEETEWAAKALANAGWQEYVPFGQKSRKPGAHPIVRTFRKQGYGLTLYVSKYTPEGETKVNYTVRALSYEIPAPPDATDVELDDKQIKLACEVPGDLQSAAAFYQKAMPAAGYKALPSEDPRPTYWNLDFGTEDGDVVVMVQLASPKGETTKVNVLSIRAAVLAEIRKRKPAPEKTPAIPAPAAKKIQD